MIPEMLDWADMIFVREERHLDVVEMCLSCDGKTTVLEIEDEYSRNRVRAR